MPKRTMKKVGGRIMGRLPEPYHEDQSGHPELDRLMRIIVEEGHSLSALSARVGVYQHGVANWRKGAAKPSIHNAEALANLLGYTFKLEKLNEN